MNRVEAIAISIVLCGVGAAVLYFAIPAIWYVVPNHFPAPAWDLVTR